jgi:6-phosphogluconolactonase
MGPIIQIYPDLAALSQAAADLFGRLARGAAAERGLFRTCLSGGSTPLRLFQLLSNTAGLPWAQMQFFWGDERLVPPDDPQSNFGQAWQMLLGPVGVTPAQCCRIMGELPPAEAQFAALGQLRAQAAPGQNWPRFDLVLLGLGADGHTASLFPGSDPQAGAGQGALAVTGSYQGRPAARLTLTPDVFNAARQVVFLVSGADKAEALVGSLNSPTDPWRWPAQRIVPTDGTVTWLVDADAASRIH